VTTIALRRLEPSTTRPPTSGHRVLYWMPFGLILASQAVLTAMLIHIGHDSGDEARYTYAGIQLWHELFKGGGSPYYETYFSGAPDLYSPMAAIAWWLGGIVAVRLMSLCFMQVATSLLFLSSRRLFGYVSALCSASIFGGLGMTHELGSYGDYDSLALMCIAFAFYCAVRSREVQWFLILPLALLLADFAKYVMLVFDPIVILTAGLMLQDKGWRRVLQRWVVLTFTTGCVLLLGLMAAGGAYKEGIFLTTLARPQGTYVVFQATKASDAFIIDSTMSWMGVVISGAVLAVIVAACTSSQRKNVLLLTVLVFAGMLVTIEGLHLHTAESMKRHDDFAAWFASSPAGWALAYASERCRGRGAKSIRTLFLALAGAGVVLLGIQSYPQGAELYPAQDTKILQQAFVQVKPLLIGAGTHEILLGGLEDDAMLISDNVIVPWWQHFDDVYIKYPVPGRGGDSHGITRGPVCYVLKPHCMYLEGAAGYRAAIKAHWFALITLIGQHPGLQTDSVIANAAEHTPGYVLINTVDNGSVAGGGGGPTWIYLPDYEPAGIP
jgi:hypothetical protein